jgi:protein TonB
MFEQTLLESSAERKPVLAGTHRVAAMLAGLAGFLVAWKLLPILYFVAGPKSVLVSSLLLGAAVTLHALMACYVFAEAKRLGLRRFGWLVVTLATSLAGFLVFLVHAARRTGDWKRATVPLASVFEVSLVGMLVLIPLIRTQALGLKELTRDFEPPMPPPPRIVAVIRDRAPKPAPRVFRESTIVAPNVIPERIAEIVDEPGGPTGPDIGVVGSVGIPGGAADGVMGGLLLEFAKAAPPPPVPVASKPKPQVRTRVGGDVQAAKLIFAPKPEYPAMAKMMRVQGKVRLEAVISADGRIQKLQVLSGHPLLIQSALAAVAQWRYQPTLLNGDPVEVQTEIEVNFILAE